MPPKRFDMTNPEYRPSGSGDFGFWLMLRPEFHHLYEFVEGMNAVAHLHYEEVWKRAWVVLNPLFDPEIAWLLIWYELENEVHSNISLDTIWGDESIQE